MTLFRKKPIIVEAVHWTGDNVDEMLAFAGRNFAPIDAEDREDDPEATAQVFDILHNTWITVHTGQWIAKGVRGEFYPIAADVLADTCEEVDPDLPDDGTVS